MPASNIAGRGFLVRHAHVRVLPASGDRMPVVVAFVERDRLAAVQAHHDAAVDVRRCDAPPRTNTPMTRTGCAARPA